MSSDSGSDSDLELEMIRRAQAQQQQQKKQQQAAKEKMQQKAQQKNKKGKKKAAEQSDEEEEDASTAPTPQRQSSVSSQASTTSTGGAPLTQYEAWRLKQSEKQSSAAAPSNGGDSDSDADGSVASHSTAGLTGSGKKKARKAQREPKANRVPIKVERAKATRQADIDSGVAGALRELAMKKKMKKKQKKAKKSRAGSEEDNEEEEEEQKQEEQHEETGSDEQEEDADSHTEDAEADDGEHGEAEQYDTVSEDMFAYREQHAIRLHSLDEEALPSSQLDEDESLAPLRSFSELTEEFSLDTRLVEACTGGFNTPTPIQAQCWPIALAGLDVIGVAHTGSGKTVAFMLPALFYIMQARQRLKKSGRKEEDDVEEGGPAAPRVLVLAPTRELAIQIHTVTADIVAKLTAPASSSSSTAALPPISPISTYVLFGGTSVETQLSSIRAKATIDVLVATPGRLLKHLSAHSISLHQVGYFVLDEADRMLDLGFEEALKSIAALMPSNRQTSLFSATWEKEAQVAARELLGRGSAHTVKVVIGSEELAAAKTVTQVVEVIDRRMARREKRLLQLLEEYGARHNRILIFVLYKKETSMLADYLSRHGWKAGSISGDRTQAQRLQALEQFRSGEVPILVATDVAARGLDIKNVTHVINFSLGLSVEQYIHRVGRCGRAGASGLAHTFVVDYDAPHTPQLVQLLEESKHPISPELREMAERASRQAAKHASGPELKGDAYFASLKAGALTKNVNLAKQLQKEAEDKEIEARIFGEEEEDEQQAGHQQRGKKQPPHKKGGGGGGRKGKGGRR